MEKATLEGIISYEPTSWYWFINYRSIKHIKIDDFLSQTSIQEEKIPVHVDDLKWLTVEDIGKKVHFNLSDNYTEDGYSVEIYARLITHTDDPVPVIQEEPMWPEDNVTRVEVIDSNGRAYVNLDVKHLEFSYQDDGKTLKLFIK